KLAALKNYTRTRGTDAASLLRMAKLGVAIDRWVADKELKATAIQCWSALEEFYGVVPCALMSMMSESLIPSACETDIGGVIGMLAMQCASGQPSALLDWNNNYGSDPDKGVFFHCSNLPKSFFERHRMDFQEIIAGTVGKQNTYGTITGRIRPGAFTYCRVATDDLNGAIAGYVGQGQFTNDKLETFGGYGVFQIPDLQGLLNHICETGFEHHVAVNLSEVAEPVYEALARYMGWDMYGHDA
ncbi:MAG: fucose isomerase, partial [Kiritimatiellae bacterium]|nr:fucose isomerase [Kiritimatiellia bacterium]